MSDMPPTKDPDKHADPLAHRLFVEFNRDVSAWMAAIGRKGGSSTSPAKVRAARENGKRPKRKRRPRAV